MKPKPPAPVPSTDALPPPVEALDCEFFTAHLRRWQRQRRQEVQNERAHALATGKLDPLAPTQIPLQNAPSWPTPSRPRTPRRGHLSLVPPLPPGTPPDAPESPSGRKARPAKRVKPPRTAPN